MTSKRGYLNLIRLFDESHPTVSAIAPLVCFVVVLTLLILMRIVSLFGAVSARCVATDEFWYSATGGNWPLVGTFFLALFLLFSWNVLVGFDDWKRSNGTKLMVAVDAVGIAALLYTFISVHDSATIANNSRAGLYDAIKIRPFILTSHRMESTCLTMQRFSGRWRVVDRKVGYYGFNIPAQWIELKPWGKVYAQDASWSVPYTYSWQPPYQLRYSDDKRWRDGYLFDAPWDFDLQGDTLVLTSPEEWFELESHRSTITLEREPVPETPVFPLSHATH